MGPPTTIDTKYDPDTSSGEDSDPEPKYNPDDCPTLEGLAPPPVALKIPKIAEPKWRIN